MSIDFSAAFARAKQFAANASPSVGVFVSVHSGDNQVLYINTNLGYVADLPVTAFPPAIHFGRPPGNTIGHGGNTSTARLPVPALAGGWGTLQAHGLVNLRQLNGLGPGEYQPFAWNQGVDSTIAFRTAVGQPIQLELQFRIQQNQVVAQALIPVAQVGHLLTGVAPSIFDGTESASYSATFYEIAQSDVLG